jgi:hypothetical protein
MPSRNIEKQPNFNKGKEIDYDEFYGKKERETQV